MSTDIEIITDEISLADLQKKLRNESDKDLFIDVRTPEEFSQGHIPGFINFPLDYLRAEIESFKDKNIVVSCLSGKRCVEAGGIIMLEAEANSVTEFRGGFKAWETAGLPIEATIAGQNVPESEYHPELPAHHLAESDHPLSKVKTNFTKAAGVMSHQVFDQAKETIGNIEGKFVALPPLRQSYFLLGVLILLSTIISGTAGIILGLFVGLALIFSSVSGIMFLTDWMEKAPWNRKK